MDVKTARRVSERKQRPVYDRVRGGPVNVVCVYWLEGRCNRNPCRFLHKESPLSEAAPKQSNNRRHSQTWQRSQNDSAKKARNTDVSAKNLRNLNNSIDKLANLQSVESDSERKSAETSQQKVCQYWLSGNCVHGEKCQDLHSWFCGNGFSMLGKLEGHNKAVSGIALASGSDKLYSGSKDKTVRIWDCSSAQCVQVVTLSGEVGSLISEGPWIFVGLPNSVRAWNSQTLDDLTLTGPVGQVHAMVVGNDTLFAGTEDGTILAWKSSSQTNCLELVASLKGHGDSVICLCVGTYTRLYSGSIDNTIRVWDLNTFKCIQTLKGHTGAVMSVICWDRYLLSCSLDGTIKAWASNEVGDIEVIHTREEEHGILALSGITDTEGKHILLCSRNDNSVCLYDLPSFTERGKLFAKHEVRSMEIGPAGHFFTGDATGQLTVWKLAEKSSAAAS